MGRATVTAASASVFAALGFSVFAADQPSYGPPPAWVKDIPIPTDAKPTGAAVDVLLSNNQQRLSPGDDAAFSEIVARVNAPEGLAGLGNLMETWDPSTQTLAIHRARIIRGGQTIDLLAGGKRFTVIRREAGLEAALIDGRLTATLQPEDLRVGDILDLAVSYTHHEPAFKDHSEAGVIAAHGGVIHRFYVRTSWLKGRAPKTFKTDDLPPLVRTDAGDRVEIGFDETDAVSPEAPKGAPPFESGFGVLLMSDSTDWPAFSRAMFPLFDKAATLSPASPLNAEIDKIAKANPDPKGRALAALELVEGDVRYLALVLNAGGLTPAPADLTWSRRFGDCKGKTALLLSLLRGLGVEAVPALVNTNAGDGLDRMPPGAEFDHVIVRATIAGTVYWLDGTRLGDEDLDILPVPDFHFALPLTASGAMLEPLIPRDPVLPIGETRLRVDLTGGLEKPAKVHREVIMRGDTGLEMKLRLNAASSTDRDRALRDLLADEDWIKPDKLDFTYDPKTMTFTGVLDGKGAPPFTTAEGASATTRDWVVAPAFVRVSDDLARTSDYHRDAPYAVAYPSFTRDAVEVILPNHGKGFSVNNAAPVHREAAAVAYTRAASLVGDDFSEIISRRALRPTFPAIEGSRAEADLKNLGNYEVSLRYEPIFPSPAANSIASSGGSLGRGEQAFAAKDFAGAEADFSEALKSAPTAKLYVDRAAARAAQGKLALAEDDLNAAIKLDPKDSFASLSLGRIALHRGDVALAQHRFEQAYAMAGDKAMIDEQAGGSFFLAKRFAEAVPWWDRQVADGPQTDRPKGMALNSDCWTRTEAGLDLKRALSMCDQAVSLTNGSPDVRETRARTRLRLGDWSGAQADYDVYIAQNSTNASALYGRSVAERRLGQSAKADADLAAAKGADPKVEATFAVWKPPG